MSVRHFGMNSERKRKRRLALFEEQSGACFWCRKPMNFKRATIDHLLPRSRGGGNSIDNHVLAHKRCNMGRGDQIWPFGKTPPMRDPEPVKP